MLSQRKSRAHNFDNAYEVCRRKVLRVTGIISTKDEGRKLIAKHTEGYSESTLKTYPRPGILHPLESIEAFIYQDLLDSGIGKPIYVLFPRYSDDKDWMPKEIRAELDRRADDAAVSSDAIEEMFKLTGQTATPRSVDRYWHVELPLETPYIPDLETSLSSDLGLDLDPK